MNQAQGGAAMALRIAHDRTRAALLAAGALLVAGALTLAGCVQQRGPAPPGEEAATQPAMGFGLSSTEDEGLKLVYGRDGTDDVLLMLECKPGTRKITVVDVGHPKARRGQMLTLTSGRMQSALPPTLETNEEGEGVVVNAQATPDLPALDSFRHTGSIAVKLGSKEYALNASPAEKPRIAEFFRGCERR
jgi:hypothetical protein